MAAPIRIDLDTELSAVNSILGAIGQAPVTRLAQTENRTYTQGNNTVTVPELQFENPEVSFAYTLLMECNLDTQTHGWVFNTETWYKLQPDANGQYIFPENILRWDISDGQVFRTSDVVRRTDPADGKSKLYDKKDHTYTFTNRQPIYFDVVWYFEWEDLPPAFQRWITIQAQIRAATQLVSNPELVQMLMMNETKAQAACQEYEMNQGDYSFFGWQPQDNVVYNSYQPYRMLTR